MYVHLYVQLHACTEVEYPYLKFLGLQSVSSFLFGKFFDSEMFTWTLLAKHTNLQRTLEFWIFKLGTFQLIPELTLLPQTWLPWFLFAQCIKKAQNNHPAIRVKKKLNKTQNYYQCQNPTPSKVLFKYLLSISFSCVWLSGNWLPVFNPFIITGEMQPKEQEPPGLKGALSPAVLFLS